MRDLIYDYEDYDKMVREVDEWASEKPTASTLRYILNYTEDGVLRYEDAEHIDIECYADGTIIVEWLGGADIWYKDAQGDLKFCAPSDWSDVEAKLKTDIKNKMWDATHLCGPIAKRDYCPYCKGGGCTYCDLTGMDPLWMLPY
jgi:hypothetical protein